MTGNRFIEFGDIGPMGFAGECHQKANCAIPS